MTGYIANIKIDFLKTAVFTKLSDQRKQFLLRCDDLLQPCIEFFVSKNHFFAGFCEFGSPALLPALVCDHIRFLPVSIHMIDHCPGFFVGHTHRFGRFHDRAGLFYMFQKLHAARSEKLHFINVNPMAKMYSDIFFHAGK
jgi:hypothetical protein